MVKHTQTLPTNCLDVFDHFMNLGLKGLRKLVVQIENAGMQKSILNKIMKAKDFARKNEFHNNYRF